MVTNHSRNLPLHPSSHLKTAIGAPGYLTNIQPSGLEIVYLFHPLGTGIAIMTVVLSLLTGLKELPIVSIACIETSLQKFIVIKQVCLLIGFLSSGSSALAFSADIAYVESAKTALKNYGYADQFRVDWGMGVWLVINVLLLHNCILFTVIPSRNSSAS